MFSYYGASDSNGAKGLLKTETVEPSDVNTVTTTYTYDKWGNKKTASTKGKNSLGVDETRTITTSFDTIGRAVVSTLNDLGQSTSVNSFNEFGSPTAATDINGINTTVFYDEMGQEYMRKDATGVWSRTESYFCSSGCPSGAKYYVRKRVSGGGSATEYFDLLGRVIRSSKVDFMGRNVFVDTEYDNLSRVKRQSTPYFEGTSPATWTTNKYDFLGRITKVTAPDNTETNFSFKDYDSTVTNPLNQTRTEKKNGLGQLLQVTDHIGGIIQYTYTQNGDLLKAVTKLSVSDTGIAVRMCYDTLGRKVAMLDPDKGGFKSTNINLDCLSVNGSTPGWWTYKYDAFGELVKQIDPKGQTSTMTYDIVGRMKTRSDKLAGNVTDSYTSWYYDSIPSGTATASTRGKLTQIVMSTTEGSTTCGGANHCTVYSYDDNARLTNTMVQYPDGTAFISSTKYDTLGRAYEQHDPLEGTVLGVSGVQTHYNEFGYAFETIDLNDGKILQRTLTTNARGQALTELRGNGAVTTNTYYDNTGLLKNHRVTVTGFGQPIQNNTYVWDTVGNLYSRQNQSAAIGGTTSKNLSETFYYDGLNRLTKTLTSGIAVTPSCAGNTQDISYDGYGNIMCKNGVGSYAYGSNAGPHAVTSTTTDGAYTYDNNGNQISGAGRTLLYTSYDMVRRIAKGTVSTEFNYGPDRARWQRKDIKAGITTTTTYIGNLERIQVSNNSTIEWKRYVGGVIYTYQTSGSSLTNTDKRYVYNDHLGSIDVITDAVGKVTHSESFDPWGARRGGEDWKNFQPSSLSIATFTQPVTTRGFTGHEMVDDMGIIHMNGRIYDQRLGRFLQADPFIQAATNTQSYNRYSYAINSGSGKLQPKGATALPDSMVNLAIDGSGRWLIGASYGGNTLSVNRIENDGSVSSQSTFFGASGGQRPHSLIMDRSGARLYVPHLATDEIRNYRFDPQSGMIDVPRATLVPVKAGSGPRHSVFSKDEKFLYLLTESTGEVLVFKHDSENGSLSLVQTAASQPPNTRLVPGKPTPPMTTPVDTTSDVVDPIASADIKMTPDGRYLFTSERTLGQISRFKIDPENGEVTLLGLTATESSPRGIAIDPDSKFLVASGQNSTTLSLYAIDFQTGSLDLIGRPSVS
ncbi:MAG: hypothetical protein EOO68_01460, partial [Moraxellaceae bacterium]